MSEILHLDVSDHAARRFKERFDPLLTDNEAREHIRELFRSAKRLHAQGSDRALYESGEVRLVVRHPGTIRAAVLTVLFLHDEINEEAYYANEPRFKLPPEPTPCIGHAETIRTLERKLTEVNGQNAMLRNELDAVRVARGMYKQSLHEARQEGIAQEHHNNKRLVGIIHEIVNGNERVFEAARRKFANAKSGVCPLIDENGDFYRPYRDPGDT